MRSWHTVTCIPVSALRGDNIARASAAMDWYGGPTLLDHLETLEVASAARAKPFRFPVQWVNRPNQDFRGFSGTIAGGAVRPGDTVAILPAGRTTSIARIVSMDGDLGQGVTGQAVILVLADEVDASRAM